MRSEGPLASRVCVFGYACVYVWTCRHAIIDPNDYRVREYDGVCMRVYM